MQSDTPILSPASSLNLAKDAKGVQAVDYKAKFDNLYKKIENFEKFLKTGKAPDQLMRYMPGLAKALYQGQLKGTQERRTYADDTYRDLILAEFTIQLTRNHDMNVHNVHLVFPLKITFLIWCSLNTCSQIISEAFEIRSETVI